MGEEIQPRLDSWDDFAGDFIKAEFVKEYPAKFPVISVSAQVEDGRNKLIAVIEYNGRSWNFDINKTNQNMLRNSGVLTPKMVIGKVLIMNKIKVRNPSTNALVDSLIIDKIE